MVVGGQNIREAVFLYHSHGNAVGERPVFVWPFRIKGKASFEKFTGSGDNIELWGASHEFNERHKQVAIAESTQRISKFDEDKLRGNDGAFQGLSGLYGEFMPRITLIHERNKEGGVREDPVHRFGRP